MQQVPLKWMLRVAFCRVEGGRFGGCMAPDAMLGGTTGLVQPWNLGGPFCDYRINWNSMSPPQSVGSLLARSLRQPPQGYSTSIAKAGWRNSRSFHVGASPVLQKQGSRRFPEKLTWPWIMAIFDGTCFCLMIAYHAKHPTPRTAPVFPFCKEMRPSDFRVPGAAGRHFRRP